MAAVGHSAFASNPIRKGGSDSTRHCLLGTVEHSSDAPSFTRRVTSIVAFGHSAFASNPNREGGSDSTRSMASHDDHSSASSFALRVTGPVILHPSPEGLRPTAFKNHSACDQLHSNPNFPKMIQMSISRCWDVRMRRAGCNPAVGFLASQRTLLHRSRTDARATFLQVARGKGLRASANSY